MQSLRSHHLAIPVLLIPLLLIGCAEGESAATPADGQNAAAQVPELGDPAPQADEAMIAAAETRQITVTPENTLIQFVGVHANPAKPDPRTGKFNEFSGTITAVGSDVKSINVEIDTASLTTEIEKLTNHLKSADFFNVNEHPKATFTSTKIEPAEAGKVTITGDLTLLGKTQPITFPATVSTENGFDLQAEFQIDRTKFGMDYGTENVLKEVDMTITVKE
jgi:polyisoprenoid-binding protein YceI